MQSCNLCGGELKSVLMQSAAPLVNNFGKHPQRFPINVGRCDRCHTMQQIYKIKDSMMYGDESYLYGSYLDKNKAQFYLSVIKNRLEELNKSKFSVLEIGGGSGWLGEFLNQHGVVKRYLNIDPICAGNDDTNIKGWFPDLSCAFDPDFVLCGNVLASINDPMKLLPHLQHLAEQADIICTAQDSGYVMTKGYLDLLFHEHNYFFDLKTMQALLEQFDLRFLSPSPLHHASLVASNFAIPSKGFSDDHPTLDNAKVLLGQELYEGFVADLAVKIESSRLPVVGIGCGPRAVKMLYDLPSSSRELITCICEPPESPKIGLRLPETDIFVVSEAELDFDVSSQLWFPYHLPVPKKFTNPISVELK